MAVCLQREEEAVAGIFSDRLAECHSFPTHPHFSNTFQEQIDNDNMQIESALTPSFVNVHCRPTFLSTSEGTSMPKMEKPKTPNLIFRLYV